MRAVADAPAAFEQPVAPTADVRPPAELARMRLRRARALALSYDGPYLTIFNFLTQRSVRANLLCVELLSAASDWIGAQELFDLATGHERAAVAADLLCLIDESSLLVEGTETAVLDERYEREWKWGMNAGLYHFSARDAEYLPDHLAAEFLVGRIATEPPVALFTTNDDLAEVVELPAGDLGEPPLSLMARRRTHREFVQEPIPLELIGDCLTSGLRITDFIHPPPPLDGMGNLPLKMTPSGGARNPFEGYVYARDVEGLRPGIHHYSATEHSLGLVSDSPAAPPSMMLGNQPYFDAAPAVLLLVANYDRVMWKYPHHTAYRVVLVEAGHIGQNVALVATARGYAAAPTSAIGGGAADRALLLDPIRQALVYGIALGRPHPLA
jgi:SagB-type dehydrogenase family enzyme